MKMNRISSSMKSFSDTKLCSHSRVDKRKKMDLIRCGQLRLFSNHFVIHCDRDGVQEKLLPSCEGHQGKAALRSV